MCSHLSARHEESISDAALFPSPTTFTAEFLILHALSNDKLMFKVRHFLMDVHFRDIAMIILDRFLEVISLFVSPWRSCYYRWGRSTSVAPLLRQCWDHVILNDFRVRLRTLPCSTLPHHHRVRCWLINVTHASFSVLIHLRDNLHKLQYEHSMNV